MNKHTNMKDLAVKETVNGGALRKQEPARKFVLKLGRLGRRAVYA